MVKAALSATLVTAGVAVAVYAAAATPGLARAAQRTTPRALSAVGAVRSCHAHPTGGHWTCVTPDAACPNAAHSADGYAKTGRSYRCTVSTGGHWRWKAL
jgi:hypothetical protein